MKQLILFFCLVALVPLGISAQEDHDIVASLNLKEVVILADGQTFEEYLIKQVLDHAQPPHRRTITFAAKLAGYSNAKLYVDRKKWPNGYISMELAYKYR